MVLRLFVAVQNVLAQTAPPDGGGGGPLPIDFAPQLPDGAADEANMIVGFVLGFALIATAIALGLGAAKGSFGRWSGNVAYAAHGRATVGAAIVAAVVIGAAGAIITWAWGFGQGFTL